MYPYYLSTSNSNPANNATATAVATGTGLNLSGLQASTAYYLWMRTYDGNSYGSWTTNPVTFTTSATLPVTLISFTAKKANSYADLQWVTESEKDNKEFIISRSADGINFVEIYRIPASSASKNYLYKDENPQNGTNYYKLSQKDFNGTEKELAVKVLNFRLSYLKSQAYPNPTTGQTTLNFAEGEYQFAVLSNMTGEKLQKFSIGLLAHDLTLNLSSYPKGVYIITLIGNNENKTFKVVKE